MPREQPREQPPAWRVAIVEDEPIARLGLRRMVEAAPGATLVGEATSGPEAVRLLRETQPDIVCLQELKAPEERFPELQLKRAGYGAVWHGQSRWNGVAILGRGVPPVEIRRGLPGDRTDIQSRYVEAAVKGVVVASLYAPNGNPQPGPKFDYKLAWFKRLRAHAAKFIKQEIPVVLAGDYNVAPTPFDIYPTRSWDKDALIQPKSRAAFASLVDQGWLDAVRELHRKGFRARRLIDGFPEWKRAGLPVAAGEEVNGNGTRSARRS